MTQTEILRAAFERGERLTVAEALTRYGIYALSQRCGELKRQGFKLGTQMVALPSGRELYR